MAQRRTKIDIEAAQWAVRLRIRQLTAEEQLALERWLEADSRHRGALLRARAVWVDLDRLAALAGRGERDGTVALPRLAFDVNRRWLIAAGTAALMFAGGAGALWRLRGGNVYVSRVGEIRRVRLSDGSRMVLNTDSMATVRFDDVEREIDLRVGEGLFQVAKDPKRPFIVRAGSVSVRAVGTVFAVRAVNDRVDVTVTEGVVELVDATGPRPALTRRLAANEHATIMETRQLEVQHLSHDEAERWIAWRRGMLEFAGESLRDAVSEMNRHNTRHIIVDDQALGERPIVGLFRANDPQGFASTVAIALGARWVDENGVIHLRPRAAP